MNPLKIFGSLTNSFIIHLNQLARNIIVRRRDYVENFMGTEVLKRNRLRTQSAKFSMSPSPLGPTCIVTQLNREKCHFQWANVPFQKSQSQRYRTPKRGLWSVGPTLIKHTVTHTKFSHSKTIWWTWKVHIQFNLILVTIFSNFSPQ